MKNPFLLAAAVSITIMCGCNNRETVENINVDGEKRIMQSTIDSLQKLVTQLQEELDVYKYAPEKLCANAEQLFKSNNEDKLKDILGKLRQYHPEASEIKTIEGYLNTISENRAKEQERTRAERMKAVDVLSKKYDDVNGIMWFYSKQTNHKVWSNMASLYIGKDNTSVWLRLKMSYYGDDWIFFENAYLSYEGNTYTIPFDRYSDKKTENSGGMVWEWIDVGVTSDLLSYLNNFVRGESPKMRLSGKYTHTRNLSSKEIKSMQEILLAYDVLRNGQ